MIQSRRSSPGIATSAAKPQPRWAHAADGRHLRLPGGRSWRDLPEVEVNVLQDLEDELDCRYLHCPAVREDRAHKARMQG